MVKYINIAEQKTQKFFRGEYKTYDNAINYGKKDLQKMRDAVVITGNKNNVKRITMRTYKEIDGKRQKSACYVAHVFVQA